jgi:hypothetical protein
MNRVLIATCLSIHFLAVFHASSLAQTPAGQTKEAIISNIRESFQKINTDQGLKTVELEGEEFLPDEAPDGGCSLKGYFKGDTLCKMHVWVGISYCVRQYDYYLKNGMPFFIYETEQDYPVDTVKETMDHTKLTLVFEGRYYLDKRKVIDIKIKGRKRMDEAPSAASINELVSDVGPYSKLLQARWKKR